MPPIIPRERFGAERRDLLRIGDILIGQARANPRPCVLEPRLRVERSLFIMGEAQHGSVKSSLELRRVERNGPGKNPRGSLTQFPVGKDRLIPSFFNCSRMPCTRKYCESVIGPV
jgi:hypothetical protein